MIRTFIRKIEKAIGFFCIKFSLIIRPGFATTMAVFFYGRWGMKFHGKPNYLSARINFDGTNYAFIEIHEGVTISSFVRILTHDASFYTVAKSIGVNEKPLANVRGVSIGAYRFIGTGSIIMPGSNIGRGCLIGAGTVIRGNIPEYSIVIGSPGEIVGDTREYIKKHLTPNNNIIN